MHQTPDHIIPNLPILPPTSERQHDVLIFLVTPAFASWVDEDHPFLKESIGHIFQDAHGPACVDEEFQSIVAVVDKLPSPQGHEGSTNDTDAIIHGFEGLSMMLVDRTRLTGDLAKTPVGRSSHPSEPAITYSAKSPVRKDGQSVSHEVGLRLANTLFVNGNHRTIFASSWRHDRDKDELTLKQKRDLSACHISSASERHIDLQVPLHPVTQRRKVLFSMGNILRQISKDDASDQPIPASSELEKELPRYVQENNLMDHRLAVWALIEPINASNNATDGGRIPNSIRNGARLHRVVSGGGGWGKKQGLLSLDPENRFTEDCATHRTIEKILEDTPVNQGNTDPTAEVSFPPGFSGFSDEPEITSINQTAKDGEFVQFFVAPERGSIKSELSSSRNTGSDKEGDIDRQANISGTPSLTCTFGTIPTPDDSIPTSQDSNSAPPSNAEESAESSPIISLKNYFGALSEKGITYSSAVGTEASDTKESEDSLREMNRTKLGIPGARVSFV